ncbi:hypothetical protein AGMMS49965_09690 [Bacteroidia bacterium]|nr:hypothetical protein AGMMS49965_09690 [Bacteroidia bacterium]
MKKIALILSVLALPASGYGNKNVSFDYSTLPTKWTNLMPTGIDGEFVVCDGESDVLLIEGNKLTFAFVVGVKWELEILNSYQINDTIVLSLKSADQGWAVDWNIVWLDRERGIAEWSVEHYIYTFVTDENLSKFPKAKCSRTDEGASLARIEKNPEDLMYSNDTVFEKIAGDLNNDDEDDCVIITKQTKKSAFVTDEYYGELDCNRRGMVIALKEGEEYNLVEAISDCFSSEYQNDGGYVAAAIEKGNLLIHCGHGSDGWWCRYTFRYRNRNNDFELIGYEQTNTRGPVRTNIININFLTKKKQTLFNTNLDAGEVFEETWQDIEMPNGLVELIEIYDFDKFNIDRYYVEK